MIGRGVVFNGKFLSASPTGVHRVARELIAGVDQLIADRAGGQEIGSWRLVCPRNARRPLPLRAIERRSTGLLTWQAWEQLELPALADGDLLVNLCNIAPLATAGAVTLIHDAHVFITPESNSTAFGSWYKFALPRIGAAAARIVTVSEFSRARLVQYGVAPADKIEVIPNGADHLLRLTADDGVFERLGLADRGFVLALANVQEHKNVAMLFSPEVQAALEGRPLVLVGAADASDFAAAGHPPPPGVVFAGHCSDAELRALYEHALCLAFPSTTEGFGLPPLEAMGLSCPVVTTGCGALRGTCGAAPIYADPHEPAEWAEAFRRLTDDEALRARLVAAGIAQAGRYRWADSARRMLDLIVEVAAGVERQPARRSA